MCDVLRSQLPAINCQLLTLALLIANCLFFICSFSPYAISPLSTLYPLCDIKSKRTRRPKIGFEFSFQNSFTFDAYYPDMSYYRRKFASNVLRHRSRLRRFLTKVENNPPDQLDEYADILDKQ